VGCCPSQCAGQFYFALPPLNRISLALGLVHHKGQFVAFESTREQLGHTQPIWPIIDEQDSMVCKQSNGFVLQFTDNQFDSFAFGSRRFPTQVSRRWGARAILQQCHWLGLPGRWWHTVLGIYQLHRPDLLLP
jgi:hypothetical protein